MRKWLLVYAVIALTGCLIIGIRLVRATGDELYRVVEQHNWSKAAFRLVAGPLSGVWLVQHDAHPQDRPLHDLFYSKWQVPNQGRPRRYSCCNNEDCYPTPIRYEEGRYWALRREDQKWLLIPQDRLEQLQADPVESPDHQSHACISRPAVGNHVYCATLGEGI